SIACTAKAAQSLSGAKHISIVADGAAAEHEAAAAISSNAQIQRRARMRLVRARIKTVGRLSQRAKRHTHQVPLAVFLYAPFPQNGLIRVMSERDDYPGFAPELDAPIAYMQ